MLNCFPANHPVHEISAWSGTPKDETPICGADRAAVSVCGYRTVYTASVTCLDCRRIRDEWDAENESLQWAADGEAAQHPRERW